MQEQLLRSFPDLSRNTPESPSSSWKLSLSLLPARVSLSQLISHSRDWGTQDMSTGTRGHQDPRTLGHWGHCGSGKWGHQTLGHGDTSPGDFGDTRWVPDPLGISAPAPGSSPSPPIFIPFYQKQKEKQLWNQNTEKQQAYV